MGRVRRWFVSRVVVVVPRVPPSRSERPRQFPRSRFRLYSPPLLMLSDRRGGNDVQDGEEVRTVLQTFFPSPPFSQHAPRKAPKTTPSPPPCCLDTYSGPCPPRTTGRVGHYYLAREKRYDPPVPRPSCDVTVGGATDEYPPAPCRTRFVPYTVGAYAIIRLIDNIVAYA